MESSSQRFLDALRPPARSQVGKIKVAVPLMDDQGVLTGDVVYSKSSATVDVSNAVNGTRGSRGRAGQWERGGGLKPVGARALRRTRGTLALPTCTPQEWVHLLPCLRVWT